MMAVVDRRHVAVEHGGEVEWVRSRRCWGAISMRTSQCWGVISVVRCDLGGGGAVGAARFGLALTWLGDRSLASN